MHRQRHVPSARLRAQQFGDLLQRRERRGLGRRLGLRPRQVDQRLDRAVGLVDVAQDHRRVFGELALRARPPAHRFDAALDDGERIAQVVRDAGGELGEHAAAVGVDEVLLQQGAFGRHRVEFTALPRLAFGEQAVVGDDVGDPEHQAEGAHGGAEQEDRARVADRADVGQQAAGDGLRQVADAGADGRAGEVDGETRDDQRHRLAADFEAGGCGTGEEPQQQPEVCRRHHRRDRRRHARPGQQDGQHGQQRATGVRAAQHVAGGAAILGGGHGPRIGIRRPRR